MPLIAALVSSLFGALGVFLAKIFAVKLPIRLAAVAAISGLAAGLLLAFNTMLAPLVAMAFSTSYGQFIGLAFPPVAGTVLTTYFGAYLAVIAYKLKTKAIAITATV